MRKIILLVLTLTINALAQNTMFLPDTSGLAGDTVTVKIHVNNADAFVAVQTDIQLPNEISFIANTAQLTSRSSGHIVSASLLTGNVLRLIAFSLNQTPFTGNTGAVVTFKVKLGKKPGIYPLLLINPIISNAQSQNILTGSANGNVTIFSPDIDLNFNQIDYGRVPWYTSGFNSFTITNTGTTPLQINRIYSSDKYFVINSDTSKTIQPGGTHQVNIEFKSLKKGTYNETVTILSNDPDEPVVTVNVSGTSFAVNELRFGTASGRSGYAIDLPVSVNNMEPFTGIQFDLLLPSVVKYSGGGAVLSSRKNDHVVSVNEVSPGRVRVIAFSPQNMTFADSLGELMKIGLTLDGTGGNYYVQPDSVFITGAASTNLVSASYGNSVTIVSPDISGEQNIDLGEVSLPDTLSYTYTLYNTGSDTLRVDQITSSNPLFRVEYSSLFIIPQGGSKSFKVYFHADQKGTHAARLILRSNDPDEDPFYVNLSVNTYAPNYIVVPNLNTRSGDTVTVKIDINNYEGFVAFQTDIKLPPGFLYKNNSAVLTARKADHILNVGTIAENTFRLFAFSLSQQAFSGNSGTVAELKFAVGNISGTFPVELSGGVISNAQSQNIIKAVQNGSITVYPVPAKPVLIAPLNNDVNQSITPSFTWGTSAGSAKYRLQLSTVQTFNTLIADTILSDTNYTSPQLSCLIDYYWRVRAENEGGAGEWSDIWKFTTIIQKPEAPVPAFPANNVNGVIPPATVKWYKSPRAERYFLQVSEYQNFSSLAFADSLLTDSVAPVTNLRFYTQYYWRIKAINSGGESAWSDVWTFKTLGSAYPVTLVSPVNQSENLPVNGITFKWRKATERIETILKYQFQLAEDSLFVVLNTNDSTLTDTSVQVINLRYGTGYYWRVRASNETGWGNWSQVWTLKTIIEKPVAPLLASPASNSVGLIQPIILKWNKSARAEEYTLEIATDSAFASVTNTFPDLTDTLKQLPALSDYTKYYWRVKAINIGGESGWSVVFNFKTIGSPYGVTLIQPANESVNNLTDLAFKWQKPTERIESITDYHFQLSTDSLFGVLLVNDSTLTDTTKSIIGLSYLTKYFWRVRAGNETGWGDWSQVWSFTTIIERPTIPVLAGPANNSNGLLQPITVRWNKPLRAEKYKLQISLSPEFITVLYSDTLLTDTLKLLPSLANYTAHYWRVMAYNTGGSSTWSEIWNFKTLGSAYPVSLVLPVNQSANLPVNNIIFKWRKATERIETILKYQFQLAEDSLFAVLNTNDSTLTDTSAQVNNLRYGMGYFWRVRALNETGWGDWSELWRFSTIIEKPAAPILASPVNNSVKVSQPVILRWYASPRAAGYILEVSGSQTFNTILFADSAVTDTFRVLPALSSYTQYYWRVSAYNQGGVSNVSGTWNFRTLGVPTTVSLLYPPNGSVNQSVNILFNWTRAYDQKSNIRYWFVLTMDTSGATVVSDSALTDTLRQVTGLLYDKTYYWRVCAGNEAGWGSFSGWFTFRTIVPVPTVPVLSYPVNNTTGVSLTPLLIWNRTAYTEKYHLQLSADSIFSSFVINDSTLTDTSYLADTLQHKTTYFWRVKSINIAGNSAFSDTWRFKTEIKSIAAPSNLTASAAATREVKLTWNDNSNNELGFIILRKEGDSTSVNQLEYIDTVAQNAAVYYDTHVTDSTLYSYLVLAYNSDTVSAVSNYAVVRTLTSIKEFSSENIPTDFYLGINYPNPFNPSTMIEFGLPREAMVDLSVFDISGRRVKTLVSRRLSAGSYNAGWDGKDHYGATVPSGIYLYRIRAEAFVQTKKLILLK
ncbi:MAG: choice-of-anchor D domain-containing protein [Ignavibacteriaceae bacterium]|nr:choice-of-anchor D domain-containing protein [Ignavibacteriaceae bacterium]